MKIRLILAIWVCKLAIIGSRILGKRGTSMPGQLAMKICPSMLTMLSRQVKKDIIVVCGTNGKTTTNNLLAAFIRSAGHCVVCNEIGANMIWGVCCAFAEKANLFGKLRADYACLEVDEASCVKVFRYVTPTVVVMTNLFRDQLDRYGAIEQTADFLRRALEMAPDARLILNGDDPLVAQFGKDTTHSCFYMGVDEDAGADQNEQQEGQSCVFCGEGLVYEYHHYSQLGKFSCPGCGWVRPALSFRVHDVSLSNGLTFTLDYLETSIPFQVHYRGFYNIYNIALSYAAAALVMDKLPDHQAVLKAYQPQIGRMEEFSVGKPVILNLAKNPAGFNQAVATVTQDSRQKNVLLAVNDQPSDGRDISWIWDVEFEKLSNCGVSNIVVTGSRADELALRMKYAEFPVERCRTIYDMKEALASLVDGEAEICYALANYTAVFTAQAILKEMEGAGCGK